MSYPAGKYINAKYTPDELTNKFAEYIEYCKDNEIKMPNTAGFCIFAKMSKQTIYNYENDENYKDAMETINMMHEDATLNSKENPIMRIFYMKNKFDYIDKKELVTTNNNLTLSIEDIEARKQELIGKLVNDKLIVDVNNNSNK
jgi:hypothetical protein